MIDLQIILISGKAQNGKSETAKILKRKLELKNKKVLITAFGNLVKFSCNKFFGTTYEKTKENRSTWQRVGTDIVRKQNENFWVDLVISFILLFEKEAKWDYVIIDDCRFTNELERFSGFDTINLRINRLNFQSPLTSEQQNHISETKLDNYEHFDYIINAESGLDNLEREVDMFLKWLGDKID